MSVLTIIIQKWRKKSKNIFLFFFVNIFVIKINITWRKTLPVGNTSAPAGYRSITLDSRQHWPAVNIRVKITLYLRSSQYLYTRDGTSDFFDSVKPAYHHKYRPHAAYTTSQDFAFDSKISSNENILMFIFPWNFILRPDVFIENYLLQDKGELNAKEILSYNLFQYNFPLDITPRVFIILFMFVFCTFNRLDSQI